MFPCIFCIVFRLSEADKVRFCCKIVAMEYWLLHYTRISVDLIGLNNDLASSSIQQPEKLKNDVASKKYLKPFSSYTITIIFSY